MNNDTACTCNGLPSINDGRIPNYHLQECAITQQHNILTPDQPMERITSTQTVKTSLWPDQPTGLNGHITDPKDYARKLDGTAGHSKGKWFYYGDVACGIATDCQHKADDPISPVKFVFSPHQHESDDLIPMLTEEDFDNLSTTDDDVKLTWDQYRSNLRLMALAQHAPHDCGDYECPGVINKKRLEMTETPEHKEMLRLRGEICDALIAGRHWHGGSNEQIVSTIIHLCKIANDQESLSAENKRKLELYDKFQYAIKAFADEGLLT